MPGEANAGRREAHRLAFRVGINLGAVLIKDDDIDSDGVNSKRL